MQNIMEQETWFEKIQFDKNDYPIQTPSFIDSINFQSSLFDEYNLFDYAYGFNRYIKLSELLEANTKSQWNIIREKVKKTNSITIINDLSIKNEELGFILDFYITTFYSALKNDNPNCYIYNSIAS